MWASGLAGPGSRFQPHHLLWDLTQVTPPPKPQLFPLQSGATGRPGRDSKYRTLVRSRCHAQLLQILSVDTGPGEG